MKSVPKYGWRVTKYNPAFRSEKGAYLKDEWTSISDVGKSFDGKMLTMEGYQQTENNYISTAMRFLSESGLTSLQVPYVEKNKLSKTAKQFLGDISYDPKSIIKGMLISAENLENICRLVIREILWCRLESEGKFYIHFGYDYYMYIGSYIWSNDAINYAETSDLFVEEMLSPYLNSG